MSYYFVLVPGSRADLAEHLCRPMIGNKDRYVLSKLPWVGVAQGVTAGAYDLLPRRGLTPETGRQAIREAEEHLKAQKVTWNVAAKSGLLFKKPSQLRAILFEQLSQQFVPTLDSMDDLSTEQLLNGAEMAKAAEILRSPDLLAVVPRRGWLYISAGHPGELWKSDVMHQIGTGLFEQSGPQGISPDVFFWQNGQLNGISVKSPQENYLSIFGPDEATWNL